MASEVLKKRSLLIVDGAYLIACAYKINKRIDYVKLVAEIEVAINNEFYEKWFLNSCVTGNAQSAFHNMLRAAPPKGPQFRVKLFGLKTHTTTCRKCRSEAESTVQKGVDVGIATLMLKHAFQNLCDQVVLLAGDGDFFDAVATVKDELRKDLCVLGFRDGSLSLELQQIGRVIWLDDLIQKIEMVPEPAPAPPAKVPAQEVTPVAMKPKPKYNKPAANPPRAPQVKPTIAEDGDDEDDDKEEKAEEELLHPRSHRPNSNPNEANRNRYHIHQHSKPVAQQRNVTVVAKEREEEPNIQPIPEVVPQIMPNNATVNSVSGNIAPRAPQVAENGRVVNGDVWGCIVCTFDNPLNTDVCEMCEKPRPVEIKCAGCGYLKVGDNCAYCTFMKHK